MIDESIKTRDPSHNCTQSESSYSDSEYLTIPYAMIAYNSSMLYSTYMILESQLSQIDPLKEPEMYQGIEKLVQTVFDSWVMLGNCGGGADGIRV